MRVLEQGYRVVCSPNPGRLGYYCIAWYAKYDRKLYYAGFDDFKVKNLLEKINELEKTFKDFMNGEYEAEHITDSGLWDRMDTAFSITTDSFDELRHALGFAPVHG